MHHCTSLCTKSACRASLSSKECGDGSHNPLKTLGKYAPDKKRWHEARIARPTHGYSLGGRYRLHRHDLPGRPDLVFPGRHKIIFVHGCFWHQHRRCKLAHRPRSNLSYWTKKLSRNVRRDARNLQILKDQGWYVLVIWECETREPTRLRRKLSRFLKQRVVQ